LWSIKTGHYYFNKRTGKCQYDRPAGFIPLPEREMIQAAPSEDPIPEVEEEAERAEENFANSVTNEMKQNGQPTSIQQTTNRGAVPIVNDVTTRKATDSNTDADNAEQNQRAIDSGIDDNSM
jgi:hypothetical protein